MREFIHLGEISLKMKYCKPFLLTPGVSNPGDTPDIVYFFFFVRYCAKLTRKYEEINMSKFN